MRFDPESAPSSRPIPTPKPAPLGSPEAMETLRRGFRMAARQCWGAVLALGLDEPIAREVFYRAEFRAIEPEEAGRHLRPEGWSRRIARLEDYTFRELVLAIEESGIPRSYAMHQLAGQASHEACDALMPPVSRCPAPPRGRPRDVHGRFVATRAVSRHRAE